MSIELIGLILLISCNVVVAASPTWLSVPITTVQQNKAQVSGGEGFQRVMSIVYSKSDPNIIYFSTDTAQVWKSTDNGANWSPKGNGFSANGASSLFVSPRNPDLVLAAAFLGKERERINKRIKPLQGIFRSTDGGDNWSLVHQTEFYKQESSGALFVSDSRSHSDDNITIYAGSYDEGLLKSNDDGQRWKYAGFKSGHIIDIDELPAEPGKLIIATDIGLYSYKDGVVIEVGEGLPQPPLSVAVSADAPSDVYVVTPDHGVFRSGDNGKTFAKTSSGLPVYRAFYSDIAVSPVDSKIMYLDTHKTRPKGPFFSNTGGDKWRHSLSTNAKGLIDSRGFYFSSPFSPHPSKPLEALSASNGWARIVKTVDGGKTWFYSGSGYTAARVVDIAFRRDSEMILALTDHGVWGSTSKGSVFHPLSVSGENGSSAGALAISGQAIVASIGAWGEKNLAVSRDGGKEWELFEDRRGTVDYVAFHPKYKNIVYAGPFRSDDGARSWERLRYKVVAMAPDNGDLVYGLGDERKHLFRSEDRGKSWKKLPKLPGYARFNEASVDQLDNQRLYVASSAGIYIYDGSNWISIGHAQGLLRDSHGANNVKAIEIDPGDPNVIYAGKWAPGKGISNGIFKSTDRGNTWRQENGNLGDYFNVWGISINPFNGSVYVATTCGLKKLEKVKSDD